MLIKKYPNTLSMPRACRLFAGVASVAVLLAGCGQKDEKAAPSQVLAKVNDGEITVMQLNGVLRGAGNTADQALAKQNALDYLVNQEILQQKAAELKLDRDPDVMQAVEQAKRQILAAAALSKLQAKAGEPGAAEVQKFYESNPALFSQHATYEFTMFNLPVAQLPGEVKAAIEQSHSAAQTKQALESMHQAFQEKTSRVAADQLPMDLLLQLFKLKAGDILVRPEAGNVMLVQLVRVEGSPVSLADSKERIVAYLKQTAEQESANSKLAELKKAAKVTYLKRFANNAAASAPAAAANGLSTDTVNSGLKGF
ncbi:EpsD family peptidyl-prolyl cis-trans isomerase [Aquitalea denitrificans]|uniref:EpsD family peptidyl-prolyl cis-trans isomerase n=1 Tax=Aquitalea denitrificans TaxID=519081 RepID=UPI00135B53EE|nr:EpsD family peptidyl-prolyl cis-trans isomerase [Aquitalea denitrificans]